MDTHLYDNTKISQNLRNNKLLAFKTTYHSSLSAFMMNNTLSGAKKHRESTEPERCQTAKMFFFLSSSTSDRLVLNRVTP